MQDIKAREVIAYATMPRIVPRLKGLFTSGFGYVSYLMAQVYSIVRLIPKNHPYLQTENIGRYGIRHVVAEASRNLSFSTKNIDQFIIFFALLAGLVILMVQVVLFAYALLVSPSLAASWFDTTAPEFDIAFNLLDQIFGIPGIYCSTSAPGTCTDYAGLFALPLPYHLALHGLFQFYSTGLLLIAVLIFLYFMVVVIVETAVTGTPFGQRFQNVWVPVRLVVAIGLLMPIQYGLNSGQYIILYTAKYGSGLATNGWRIYNDTIAASSMFATAAGGVPLGERHSYLAIPEAPDFTPIVEAMSLVHACAYAYHRLHAGDVAGPKANVTRNDGSNYQPITANYAQPTADEYEFMIQPFFIKNRTAGLVNGVIGTGSSNIFGDDRVRLHINAPGAVPYHSGAAGSALGFYYGSDIIIRFGENAIKNGNVNANEYTDETGFVKPLCGDIRIPISDLTDPGGGAAGRGGADHMQQFYYETVLRLWFDSEELRQVGRTLVEAGIENNGVRRIAFCGGTEGGGGPLPAIGAPAGFLANAAECQIKALGGEWRADYVGRMTSGPPVPSSLKANILRAWENYVLTATYDDYDTGIQSRGWGGAGIWYNKIAEINGGWIDAARNVPFMDNYPLIMEEVRAYNMQNNQGGNNLDLFKPSVKADAENSSSKKFKTALSQKELDEIALPLSDVFSYWNPKNDPKNGDKPDQANTENVLRDAFKLFLGVGGLADMRNANQYLHPMAQLVAVGKSLVNSAVLGMATSTVSSFLGGAARAINKDSPFAGAGDAVSQVFFAVAFMGLTAGFVLFYVLPFMPFLYFYFAVASWVKAIFEAMLGAPLWALAHMRLDGDGLPGDAASNGYFLILEIFIRPILTVFGLLAAIIIFGAQVRILNFVWDVVTTNAAGYTEVDNILGTPPPAEFVDMQRSEVDQFFFTIVYTIVCYMLALASFKLIDKIPDNILRWAGAGVSSYGDIDQDQVESISRYAATGGMTIGSQATQAVTKAAGGLGGILGKEAKNFMKPETGGTGSGTPPSTGS